MEQNKNMDIETSNGRHKKPMPPARPMPEMPLMQPPMPMQPCYPMPGYGHYMPTQPPCYHMMPQMPMMGEDMGCGDPMMYGYGGMYPPMHGGMYGYGQMPQMSPWGEMYGYGTPWGIYGMPQPHPQPEFPRVRESE